MREYREGMREFARESFLDAWYERLDADELTARFGTKLDADGQRAAHPYLPARTAEDQRPGGAQADRSRRREAAIRQRPAAADTSARAATSEARTSARPTCASCSSSTSTGSTPTASTSSAPIEFVDMARKVVGDRQRRHPGLGDPAGRPRRTGRRHAPGQGGAGVGARAAPGRQRVRHPRRAGRARPADDAGGDRHLPELAAQPRPRRRRARLLRAPAVGLEGLGRPVADDASTACSPTPGPAPGRWPARTPARATAWRSPPTSARAAASTGRSHASPPSTPTRTSSTIAG